MSSAATSPLAASNPDKKLKSEPSSTQSSSKPSQSSSPWLSAPQPILKLFKTFPLAVLPANNLPHGRPNLSSNVATLFIWSNGPEQLSYNPSCLKWQVYLRFSGLPFTTVPSNNHASPSGSLPFLLPATSDVAIPSSSFLTFISQTPSALCIPPSPPSSHLTETYTTLIQSSIHTAWLYSLYMSPENTSLLRRLYIDPISSSATVRTASLRSLRNAARSEILVLTRSAFVIQEELYTEARVAFAALEAELTRSATAFFFASKEPTIFDATVFAYVHLLLDESLVWGEDTLPCSIVAFSKLVEHRDNILHTYWPGQNH